MLGRRCSSPNVSVDIPIANKRIRSEFGRSGREIFGERSEFLLSTFIINGLIGDVNLENRLQKAARNIPQQQQMRAYSTTSRPSNALRRPKPSRRTPLMSCTRSYATHTTNPNPPYGKTSVIAILAISCLILILLQDPRIARITPHQRLPLSVSVHTPGNVKLPLTIRRRQRLYGSRYETFPRDYVRNLAC